jgi:hypothetical protein
MDRAEAIWQYAGPPAYQGSGARLAFRPGGVAFAGTTHGLMVEDREAAAGVPRLPQPGTAAGHGRS